jgi:transposase InsO family protein
VWVYFLTCKSNTLATFKTWLTETERSTGLKLRVFHSDGGGEYTSKIFTAFLKEHGIVHETTSPDTPEQNGRAERAN